MIETVALAILQTGAVGGVLVWHLFRTDGRMRALEEAQNRTTRAILLLTVSQPSASVAHKREAEAIYNEMLDAQPRTRDAGLERGMAQRRVAQ